MKDILTTRNWRYATKKFNPEKKVSNEHLELLLEATRLSASSYGLQPYQILVVTNPEIRKQLLPFSWNQPQIEDASHLIIFVNKSDFGEELIDDYVQKLEDIRGISEEVTKPYGDFMKSKLINLPHDIKNNWTALQVYLALGNAIQAAAELEIDTCPIEGFEPAKYNEILNLNDKDLNAAVVLAIGYRSEEDETQHYAKVRKTKEELFIHI